VPRSPHRASSISIRWARYGHCRRALARPALTSDLRAIVRQHEPQRCERSRRIEVLGIAQRSKHHMELRNTCSRLPLREARLSESKTSARGSAPSPRTPCRDQRSHASATPPAQRSRHVSPLALRQLLAPCRPRSAPRWSPVVIGVPSVSR
jgi:hypothetical protein